MAGVVAPPSPPPTENRVVAFYQAVMVEMRKVTWPELTDVRRATVAIIVFVLLIGLFIYLLDVSLQGILGKLIPSLFVR